VRQNAATNFFNGSAAAGGGGPSSAEEGAGGAAGGAVAGGHASSNSTALETFLSGYAGAVAVAMGFTMGSVSLVRRLGGQTPLARRLALLLPFPAVAAANVCNTWLVRRHELDAGIDVMDSQGQVLGRSPAAAGRAIYETAVTRVMLPAGNFLVTPLILAACEPAMRRSPAMRIPIIFGVTLGVFLPWLPASLALYPQRGTLDAGELEPELRRACEGRGELSVRYNKGL
jgi:hypothetical protein